MDLNIYKYTFNQQLVLVADISFNYELTFLK